MLNVILDIFVYIVQTLFLQNNWSLYLVTNRRAVKLKMDEYAESFSEETDENLEVSTTALLSASNNTIATHY